MIKKIILINSANFNYLDVSLEKDLFFLGDNGSGKTTVIRAIHYLYSGDVRNLGIPTDKDGFKEYYFRYPNSYMIYVFEDFFIFMYKTSTDIVKIFSKQKFDISKVINEDSKLYELDAIKRYAKSANLHKSVKSLNEYRDIIYANDKRYIDFKLSNINNTDVFLGLFNEIFNIDKSIIDSKSIKRAIQTTLNYEKKVMDFNHDGYLQDIYKYQLQYRFFKEFENEKVTIDKAYTIKNQLLEFEHELHELTGFIKYRYNLEDKALQESLEESAVLDAQIKKSQRLKTRRTNTLECTKKSIDEKIIKLNTDIRSIEKLKEEYSQENILASRDYADKFEELQEKHSSVKENFIKLNAGFEDALGSVDDEIKSLEYKRDKELQRELENKKENKKKFLKSQLQESIDAQELELKTKENRLKIDIDKINDEIKQLNQDIAKVKEDLNEQELKYKDDVKYTNDKYIQKQSIAQESIKAKHINSDEKQRAITTKEYEIEDLQRQKQSELQSNESTYISENSKLDKEIRRYTNMIESKPNSFKEFLNDEVDGWELELYPFLDDSLLEMSVDTLKPKLLDAKHTISIDLNKEPLKSMLTKDEANSKIESLTLQKDNLKQSYELSVKEIQNTHDEKLEILEKEIVYLKSDIESLEGQVHELRDDILHLDVELKDELDTLLKEHNNKLKEYNNDIQSYKDEIENNDEFITQMRDKLQEEKRKLQVSVQNLEADYEQELSHEYKELQTWMQNEMQKIEILIQEKVDKKNSITKDDRIKELEQSIAELDAQINKSRDAKLFLERYEDSKESIDSLLELKNTLVNLEIKYGEFKDKLAIKIENYEYEIDKLTTQKKAKAKRDKNFKKGFEGFEHIECSFDHVEELKCDEYLFELVDKYSSIIQKYKSKKIDLKVSLEKINRLKNSQNELDINFDFDEWDTNVFVSQNINIVAKIEEVYEYKNKKFEIAKESSHKKFFNFVNNSLPQKMSIFNDSEDKFLSQVQKINKNLHGIDFGVIKDIKLETKVGDKKSIARLLTDLNENVSNLSSLLNENSLFYENSSVLVELGKLESKFKEIKSELKGSSISLQDTIDLSLSFNENSKVYSQVSQLKNESSTGGSMLLKIAIAISILQLFIKDEQTPFFLIVDEVSRLHSDNQERLREFANSKGFGIVFVTPEPTYSKPESIKYYRFRKNVDDEFEAIELNV